MNSNKLISRIALVTGASRGVGQQIAVGLAKYRCNVIVHSRKKENNEKTMALLSQFPIEAESVEADLEKPEEIDKMTQYIIDKYNGVDILYNNAAIMNKIEDVWDIPMETWRRVYEVNVFAVVQLCKAFVPIMKDNCYGRVINLTSGMKDLPGGLPYASSKGAIDRFTKDVISDGSDYGVLFNYLDPGWLRTDMGGPNAEHDVETVVNGALKLAMFENNGPNGQFFYAQDYKNDPEFAIQD